MTDDVKGKKASSVKEQMLMMILYKIVVVVLLPMVLVDLYPFHYYLSWMMVVE